MHVGNEITLNFGTSAEAGLNKIQSQPSSICVQALVVLHIIAIADVDSIIFGQNVSFLGTWHGCTHLCARGEAISIQNYTI